MSTAKSKKKDRQTTCICRFFQIKYHSKLPQRLLQPFDQALHVKIPVQAGHFTAPQVRLAANVADTRHQPTTVLGALRAHAFDAHAAPTFALFGADTARRRPLGLVDRVAAVFALGRFQQRVDDGPRETGHVGVLGVARWNPVLQTICWENAQKYQKNQFMWKILKEKNSVPEKSTLPPPQLFSRKLKGGQIISYFCIINN